VDVGAGTVAAASGDTVVLGYYPQYLNKALALGARYFNIPTAVWNRMSSVEQWAANQSFLNRAVARGAEIVLATPANMARAGSYFTRELQYLQSKGFTLSGDGSRMLPPRIVSDSK
jgi:hypothetical protein